MSAVRTPVNRFLYWIRAFSLCGAFLTPDFSALFTSFHGVKGETHDVTLYLETFEQNGRDLKRVLPLLTDRPVANKPVIEYARRCVYVGLSRPKKLLCVAITGDTYESNKDAFKDWEVIDIRV